ncbi:MAG: N-acetyltransferase family protein [bacterium]|nr:N-acetyltransferase family protein [bacterium]
MSVEIRDATVADAPAIAVAYNAYVGNGNITFDGDGKSVDDFSAKLTENNPAEAWIVADNGDGTLAGYGALFPWSDRCGYKTTGETSVYLMPGQQRRGIGSAIKRALIDKARELGYHHLVAKLVADNAASREYNLCMGYEIVGTQREVGFVNGRWHDVVIMQLILD